MDVKNPAVERYEKIVSFLSGELRRAALGLPERDKGEVDELRARVGRPFSVLIGGEERIVKTGVRGEESSVIVRPGDLSAVLELLTGSSAYAAQDSLKDGYLTLAGGHRAGVCGTILKRGGEAYYIKNPSSVAIRVAREIKTAGEGIPPMLVENGQFQSTLILSPPGCGKTTLLRDLIRRLSDGLETERKFKVGVADERGEIAACVGPMPQFDMGSQTDVLEKSGKAAAILMLLKNMSPQIIALDEITAPEDLAAMEMASYCGVGLLATAHAERPEDLYERPLYKRLLELKIFRRYLLIEQNGGSRQVKTVEI